MSDSVFPRNCDIICFLEAKTNNSGCIRINNYYRGWKDIHETVGHGLTICYEEDKKEEFHLPTVIEALPRSVEICGEKILLVSVHRPQGNK